MILTMTYDGMNFPARQRREKLFRKLRLYWLKTSGRPQAARLLEILDRRISEKASHDVPPSRYQSGIEQ